MTMPAVKSPEIVAFERFAYAVACLNEIDPKEADEAIDKMTDDLVDDIMAIVEATLTALGSREMGWEDAQEFYDNQDELIWAYESDVLPEDYEKDAKRAFEIASMIPAWVAEDAIRFGASWEKRREAAVKRIEGQQMQIAAPRVPEAVY